MISHAEPRSFLRVGAQNREKEGKRAGADDWNNKRISLSLSLSLSLLARFATFPFDVGSLTSDEKGMSTKGLCGASSATEDLEEFRVNSFWR
jgi:hypothetical protein